VATGPLGAQNRPCWFPGSAAANCSVVSTSQGSEDDGIADGGANECCGRQSVPAVPAVQCEAVGDDSEVQAAAAATHGHTGRPRMSPGTSARSTSPTMRAPRGSVSPIIAPTRTGATASAPPISKVRCRRRPPPARRPPVSRYRPQQHVTGPCDLSTHGPAPGAGKRSGLPVVTKLPVAMVVTLLSAVLSDNGGTPSGPG
jgi:hypothetical protein